MEEGGEQRPTAGEVIAKLKDDGDFDKLRLKIIRKVKENEELRKKIIEEVKQSEIFNQDASENLKPRQVSDAIYQEVGKKIMGQISDEIWKVIRNDNTKGKIRETVESVYNSFVNPKLNEEGKNFSPAEEENGVPLVEPSPKKDANNTCEGAEPVMPPGFSPAAQLVNGDDQVLRLPSEEELHRPTNLVGDDSPPGFGIAAISAAAAAVSPVSPVINAVGDAAADAPPGFNVNGHSGSDMPPGFGNGTASGACNGGLGQDGVEGDDDLDAPPGFG